MVGKRALNSGFFCRDAMPRVSSSRLIFASLPLGIFLVGYKSNPSKSFRDAKHRVSTRQFSGGLQIQPIQII
ncbi:MAG TPA: hypothetical protein ENF37_08595 [Beggiatoa sp.]|nr:hypothetical protein [Beggiatoa sp.]